MGASCHRLCGHFHFDLVISLGTSLQLSGQPELRVDPKPWPKALKVVSGCGSIARYDKDCAVMVQNELPNEHLWGHTRLRQMTP